MWSARKFFTVKYAHANLIMFIIEKASHKINGEKLYSKNHLDKPIKV